MLLFVVSRPWYFCCIPLSRSWVVIVIVVWWLSCCLLLVAYSLFVSCCLHVWCRVPLILFLDCVVNGSCSSLFCVSPDYCDGILCLSCLLYAYVCLGRLLVVLRPPHHGCVLTLMCVDSWMLALGGILYIHPCVFKVWCIDAAMLILSLAKQSLDDVRAPLLRCHRPIFGVLDITCWCHCSIYGVSLSPCSVYSAATPVAGVVARFTAFRCLCCWCYVQWLFRSYSWLVRVPILVMWMQYWCRLALVVFDRIFMIKFYSFRVHSWCWYCCSVTLHVGACCSIVVLALSWNFQPCHW